MTGKIAVLTALILLSTLTGCNKINETNLSGDQRKRLVTAAHQTQDAHAKAAGEELRFECEIPEQFWAEPIRELKPVKVYNHHRNVVIALKINGNVEEGLYFYTTISSYVFGDVEGFTFENFTSFPFKYKRTIE